MNKMMIKNKKFKILNKNMKQFKTINNNKN